MASPFPGMDHYLEDRNIWPGFHNRLATEIADRLNTNIGPKYYADVEVRTVLEDVSIARPRRVIPDVGVVEQPSRERAAGVTVADIAIASAPVERFAIADETRLRTVNVYLTETDELVTAIEILSPYNKHGEGREEYRQKRSRLLRTSVHLVEIDLLRGGYPPATEVVSPSLPGDYVLLVNRHHPGDPRRLSEIWPAYLNQPLPVIPVPLLDPDPDAPLELNAAIHAVYSRAGYSWRLDYSHPVPDPPLRAEMAAWLDQRLSEHKQQNPPSS
ncbi:MAG: DUF4058 family protein [Caldilineaceae bacterium]|nr:DUF4058 family protein [Caldilineaceae bacterium]